MVRQGDSRNGPSTRIHPWDGARHAILLAILLFACVLGAQTPAAGWITVLAGGPEVAVSEWITVEQSMIDAFAGVSGDRQWIHVDAERARGEALSPLR